MQSGLAQTLGARKIKVLIVDDSVTICRFLEASFSEDPELDVVGYALDPFEARERIKALNPDVLTLDVEMPKMDGLTFLKNLMRLHPMPVVMFSSLTDVGATATLDSLQAGAVDFMPKHSTRSGQDKGEYINELVRKVKSAAGAQMIKTGSCEIVTVMPDLKEQIKKVRKGKPISPALKRIVAIGASTGGPQALRHVVGSLSSKGCAMVISQHMPMNFMESFAQRMDSQSNFRVAIAQDGEELLPGRGYVAPGDRHLALQKRNDRYYWRVYDGPKVSGHRPSVDVLFKSIATEAPESSLGILLTGMGDDGASGLKELRDTGSVTIIQDKKTSVVWGMPGRANAISAQDITLELQQIAPVVNTLIERS
jgi:two-component system chemotaxis response regulator CheB